MDELLAFWTTWHNVIIGHALQLLTLAGGVLIVSLSPLGRNMLAAIRNRRKDRAVDGQILSELEQLRTTLVEVTERLDATERLFRMNNDTRFLQGHPPAQGVRHEVDTPH